MGRSSCRNFERQLQEDFASTASAMPPIPPTSQLQIVDRIVLFCRQTCLSSYGVVRFVKLDRTISSIQHSCHSLLVTQITVRNNLFWMRLLVLLFCPSCGRIVPITTAPLNFYPVKSGERKKEHFGLRKCAKSVGVTFMKSKWGFFHN